MNVTITKAECVGDIVTVTGTINGQPVTATTWKSHLDKLTPAQQQAFVATLMARSVPAAVTPPGRPRGERHRARPVGAF